MKRRVNLIQKKILTAASKVFVRRGFDDATMSEIAEEADISRTLLNYYYRSKDGLFLEIHNEAAKDLGEHLRTLIDSPGTLLEKLPALVAHYINWLRLHPRLPVITEFKSREFDNETCRQLRKRFAMQYGFFRLMRQYREEVAQGKLRNIPFAHAIVVLHGITIFPFLAQDMIRADWTGDTDESFDAFVVEKIPIAVEIMHRLLSPQ